jgi:hypothetical protein
VHKTQECILHIRGALFIIQRQQKRWNTPAPPPPVSTTDTRPLFHHRRRRPMLAHHGEDVDAPRSTQLLRVELKSAFHLSSMPSLMLSSPVDSSMWRRHNSLKARRTSKGEWCETSAAGGCCAECLEMTDRDNGGEDLAQRLVMPPSRRTSA